MPTRGNNRDRGGFQYRERSSDAVRRRANQSGGAFDSLFRSDVDVISIKEGDWRLRICPPSWNDRMLDDLGIIHPARPDDWDPEGADDFGLEVYVHFGVGADNQKYLCPKKMKGEPCPVCEERERAAAAGPSEGETDKQHEEYLRNLQPTKRVVAYVIDRDERNSGPQLWNMAWSMDRDLNRLSIDKETQAAICIDHPEEGYDVEFTVTGSGIKTKYGGIAISRRSTPLSDNPDRQEDWLRTIEENPIPELLVFFDYEHMKASSAGQRRGRPEDEDRRGGRDAPPARSRTRDEDDDDRGGRSRARDVDDDDDNRARRPASRTRDADVDDPPPRARTRSRDADVDDPPPRTRSRDADDAPPARGRSRDAEVDDDPPRARTRDADADEAPPARRRISRDAEPEDDPPPARSRTRDAEPEEGGRRSLRDRVAEGRRRAE